MRGWLSGAAALLLAACSSGPRSLPDLPAIAVERFQPEAREQIRKAYDEVRASPRDAAANGRLAMTLHAYEQFGLAETCYLRARALEPGEFRWAYLAGLAQASAGRNAEAAANLREALRLNRDYLPARLRLAEVTLALGDLPAARRHYQDLVSRQADLAAAHYGLGRVQAARGDLAGAVEHYRRACELAPLYGAAHYGLALAYQKLGEPGRAQQEMDLYRQNPTGAPSVSDAVFQEVRVLNASAGEHLKRGVSLEAAGRLEEAIAEHEKAVALDPRQVQAHMNLITLYGKAGNAAKAEEHYRATVALNPNLAESHYNYGVFLFTRQRFAEAAAAFRKALEINPNYAEARGNLAFLLLTQGKLAEAEKQYRAALAAQPNFRMGHFQLGRLLLNRGQTEEAIAHFRQTLGEEGPAAAGYLYALGAALGRTGRRQEAVDYLRQARDKAAALNQPELVASIERDLRTLEQHP